MKKYKYVCDLPYAYEKDGIIHHINKGDVVNREGKSFRTKDGYIIALSDERLEKWFKPVPDLEERGYWISLFHQAAIAAMQGFISNGVVDKGNADDSRKFLAETSIKTARKLIGELMKDDLYE